MFVVLELELCKKKINLPAPLVCCLLCFINKEEVTGITAVCRDLTRLGHLYQESKWCFECVYISVWPYLVCCSWYLVRAAVLCGNLINRNRQGGPSLGHRPGDVERSQLMLPTHLIDSRLEHLVIYCVFRGALTSKLFKVSALALMFVVVDVL